MLLQSNLDLNENDFMNFFDVKPNDLDIYLPTNSSEQSDSLFNFSDDEASKTKRKQHEDKETDESNPRSSKKFKQESLEDWVNYNKALDVSSSDITLRNSSNLTKTQNYGLVLNVKAESTEFDIFEKLIEEIEKNEMSSSQQLEAFDKKCETIDYFDVYHIRLEPTREENLTSTPEKNQSTFTNETASLELKLHVEKSRNLIGFQQSNF